LKHRRDWWLNIWSRFTICDELILKFWIYTCNSHYCLILFKNFSPIVKRTNQVMFFLPLFILLIRDIQLLFKLRSSPPENEVFGLGIASSFTVLITLYYIVIGISACVTNRFIFSKTTLVYYSNRRKIVIAITTHLFFWFLALLYLLEVGF